MEVKTPEQARRKIAEINRQLERDAGNRKLIVERAYVEALLSVWGQLSMEYASAAD